MARFLALNDVPDTALQSQKAVTAYFSSTVYPRV